MIPESVVLIGVGEIGGVFARGLLKTGKTVVPINRGTPLSEVATRLPDPQLVLCTVGEKDLPDVMSDIPPLWHDKIALVQNELLPQSWQAVELNPTVISIWFEKKKGQDVKVLIPSPVYGRHAQILVEALVALEIPTKLIADLDSMEWELVLKNIYILTTNICGLKTKGNVQQMLNDHRELVEKISSEVILIQNHLTGMQYTLDQFWDGFMLAIQGDPQHQCMGRSSAQRLERALSLAKKANIATPELDKMASFVHQSK